MIQSYYFYISPIVSRTQLSLNFVEDKMLEGNETVSTMSIICSLFQLDSTSNFIKTLKSAEFDSSIELDQWNLVSKARNLSLLYLLGLI